MRLFLSLVVLASTLLSMDSAFARRGDPCHQYGGCREEQGINSQYGEPNGNEGYQDQYGDPDLDRRPGYPSDRNDQYGDPDLDRSQYGDDNNSQCSQLGNC